MSWWSRAIRARAERAALALALASCAGPPRPAPAADVVLEAPIAPLPMPVVTLGGVKALLDTGATALPQVRDAIGLGKSPTISIPVNTGGGLMADGHPVGATGVRQVVEAFQQLTHNAGERQVEGAKSVLTFNMGGSLTTCVAMIWGKN